MGGKRVEDHELFLVRQGKRHRAEHAACEYCGTTFLRIIGERTPTRFCSLSCARSRPLEDRFWSKVRTGEGCWEWTGSLEVGGYGIIGASRHHAARRAHRVAWELRNRAPVPDGLDVLHHCDNRRCVNPDHLYVGTDSDNARDRVMRGRDANKSGEKNPNAKLTKDDVLAIIAAVTGGETQTSVAKRYGISQTTVSALVRGKGWRT
jgi:hypothetical protein